MRSLCSIPKAHNVKLLKILLKEQNSFLREKRKIDNLIFIFVSYSSLNKWYETKEKQSILIKSSLLSN